MVRTKGTEPFPRVPGGLDVVIALVGGQTFGSKPRTRGNGFPKFSALTVRSMTLW
jgi:hypothetical protein